MMKDCRMASTGVTTLEYAILIIVMASALLAMHTTLKRAISYKWKQAADAFGDGRQYQPGVTTVKK